MAEYKLEGVVAPDPNGTRTSYWGYQVTVRDGEVFAEIPDELVDVEIASGRIKPLETPETPETPKKIDGRSKEAREAKE